MIQNKFHIYLVDDDDSVRKALKRLVVSYGLSVDTFPSAQTFLDSVPYNTHGCLILDVRMPGMDGFKLQEVLNERHSPLHIIFITAHAEINDRDYAIEHGADGFLIKPFNDRSLLDLIHEAMKKDKEGV